MNTELTIHRSQDDPIRSGIYRIAGILIACAGVLWAMINISFIITYLINPVSFILTRVVTTLLQLLGQPVHQTGLSVSSPLVNLKITPACTGIYQIVVLSGGLVALSKTGKERTRGIIQGSMILMGINIFRITSIYYVALLIPEWVPFIHGVFWEGVMVLFVPLFWIYWVGKNRIDTSSPL